MHQSSYPPEGSPAPITDSDEFLRNTIDKLRMRLLDLTSRNPLISFNHSGRSRRHLRVIDELPDFLHERLSAESAMWFKSLGDIPSEPDDEKTILFRRALESAKLEDPEHRENLEEAGEDPGEKRLARLEQELRARLRERLGMPPRKPAGNLTAADVARSQSLDPSFELPVSPAPDDSAAPAKHKDPAIQTLMFEEELDRTLARIRDQVRLSIDEVGVNPLFCVFGFLEWYEDAHSETPLHGPLLLYPLHMERELVRGHYQYTVRSTGEPPVVNVALAERLKRDFEIELPAFDEEEDTPEKYFALVQKVIERQKGWKVRRWITVGLFSFARIAMYQDLDPERWAPQGGLHKHPCLGRLIAGGGNEADAAAAVAPSQPEVPEPSTSDEMEVPLIADADSSQVEAIRDALAGRDLVIEGPPGTGKSQTITNIIAAALAGGKTVLFLAEKMAALSVVKDRLKDAGLDKFCLELHSTKGSRKETFAALANRLRFVNRGNGDAELKGTLARLETIRSRLTETAEALARPAGDLGISVQELFWRCQRLRGETSALPGEIDELSIPDADRLTGADVGRIVSAADGFQRARAGIVRSHGSIQQHPWHGVARHDIDPLRAEDLVRRIGQLAVAAGRAETAAQTLSLLTGWQAASIRDLEGIAPASALPDPSADAEDELIARLADPQTLAAMEAFARDIAEHELLESRTSAAFVDAAAAGACSPGDLRELGKAATGAGFNDAVASEVGGLAVERERQAVRWKSMSDLLAEIATRAEWIGPIDLPAQGALIRAVQLAREADERLLAARAPSLFAPGASDALRGGTETAQALRERRDRLAAEYAVDAIDDVNALRRHASALRGAPILPFLSPGWWRAKAAHKRLSKSGGAKARAAMAAALEDIAGFKEDLTKFTQDEQLKVLAGAAFKGADSDFSQLQRAADWGDASRARLPATDEASLSLRKFLFEQPPERVQLLGAAAANPSFADLAKELIPATENGTPRLASLEAEAARVRAQCARDAKASLDHLKLRPDWRLAAAGELADEITRVRDLGEALDACRTAEAVLGPRFKGRRTDIAGLNSSARHVRDVLQADIPLPLKEWLLASQCSERVRSLRSAAVETSDAIAAVQAALAEVEQVTPVDFRAWLGTSSPALANPGELRDHAERCESDPEGLQALIDDARFLKEAREVGLGPLLDLLQSRQAPLEGLGTAAHRLVCQSVARASIALSPVLANFTGDRHEALRREFRDLDHKLKRLRQKRLAHDLARRPVDEGSDFGPKKQWTGCALVHHEVGKQQRHIPTRELLDRAGIAVQQLMPCFMMSPLSVAQFLKAGGPKFDMVVMDEASQLRPQDAIGAIARGDQVVIVGDPKQLPPTNFFMGADELEPDEEGETAADEPSILDHAMSVLRPTRRLKWHYRSRHPSLIAFSNQEFYGDDPLILFPSPYHDRPEYGVKYVHVADGKYSGRVNLPEARRVAAAAMEHAANFPDRSLGIVALNQPQSELIAMEIDRLAAEHEPFEAWRRRWEPSLERLFVKNLENVQGDERDVIFISTVYGRDGQGNFHQRFGPINNEGGHRRLNVLFTRSKFQTLVFSSMDWADIRTDEASRWGVRALKGYLRFAKNGLLEGGRETGRHADSDFEVAVAGVLRSAGFESVPQVGVAGYFIDLGVRDPQRPGQFVLGIECDGASYHSTRSARDRDRLRQEVLERLKWRIHRVWSLDWYRNPRRETDRLLKAVRESIAVA